MEAFLLWNLPGKWKQLSVVNTSSTGSADSKGSTCSTGSTGSTGSTDSSKGSRELKFFYMLSNQH